MFKVNKLRVEIETSKGRFGNILTFSEKLNIIHGDNSVGKSTFINVILYALGLEELLGGKKEKTMKPVLRDELQYLDRNYKVLESHVSLEVENDNSDIITIKRYIKNENRDANLITVTHGAGISDPSGNYRVQDMYIHSSGASTNALGFHTFLEKFIGWHLPYVPSFKGGEKKLYLQTVFPAFFIEQVRGWGDFLSTVPTYYGIKNVTNRTIEFLLNLDVIENQKKLSEISETKQNIKYEWKNTCSNIERLSRIIVLDIVGLPSKPEIFPEDGTSIYLNIEYEGNMIPLQEYKDILMAEIILLELEENPKISDKLDENKKHLDELMDSLDDLELQFREINNVLRLENTNFLSLQEQLKIVDEDLVKNKDVAKLLKLGSDLNLSLSKDICPTCYQDIKESLLSQSIQQKPMNINENINFLDGQKNMLKLALGASKQAIGNYEEELDVIRGELHDARTSIRAIKRELVSDDRLPSNWHIERKIKLKNKLNQIEEVETEFDEYIRRISQLSIEWKNILKLESELPKEYFSKEDIDKLEKLQSYFRKFVTEFGYKSKPTDDIEISEDKYFPTVNGFDMKFDASASDHIRAIWAYTLSLYKVSKDVKANHPAIIFFDEPGQHQINTTHIKNFITALYECSGKHQFIVATSLKEDEFSQVVEDLDFNYIHFDYKSIRPMK